jgi:hypothetical protein
LKMKGIEVESFTKAQKNLGCLLARKSNKIIQYSDSSQGKKH